MAKFGTALAVGLSVAGGGLVMAVQTPPEVAKSNAALWVKELAGHMPDWPASTDLFLTNVGLLMIIAGLSVMLVKVRRRRLKRQRDAAALMAQRRAEAPVEVPLPLPIVPNAREAAAIKAMAKFVSGWVEPFLSRGVEMTPWSEFVRSTSRHDAWGALYHFRRRVLPLAGELAKIQNRYRHEAEALGISTSEMQLSVEALARPVEDLYVPVRDGVLFKLPFFKPPIDAFPAQEQELKLGVRRLEDSVNAFRAQLEPMLRCLPEPETDNE